MISRVAVVAGVVAILAGAFTVGAGGCGVGSQDGPSGEELGQVQMALTNAPAGLLCAQVTTVVGSQTITKNFAVMAGASTQMLDMGVVPTGSASFTGRGFNVICANIGMATPTWVADPVTASVLTGLVTQVTLVYRQPQSTRVTADFRPAVTSVATFCSRGFVVLVDGTVRAWGSGLTATPTPFAPFSGLMGVKLVAGNCSNTFALTNAGNVYQVSGSTAVQVTGLANVIDLTVGGSHQCAVTAPTRALMCWGGNSFGQVGNGTTTTVTSPVLVQSTVTQVEAGAYHTCAVTAFGGVKCWGHAGDNRLGFTQSTPQLSPSPELSPDPMGAVAVILGFDSSMAQRADGQYFGWGHNAHGELGISPTPVLSPTILPALAGATRVVSSTRDNGNSNRNYSCGLFPTGAPVRCWGNNNAGQLGNGNTNESTTPVAVPGLTDIVQIAVSSSGPTCALSRSGNVKCWGTNVGDGSGISRFVPTDIAL